MKCSYEKRTKEVVVFPDQPAIQQQLPKHAPQNPTVVSIPTNVSYASAATYLESNKWMLVVKYLTGVQMEVSDRMKTNANILQNCLHVCFRTHLK